MSALDPHESRTLGTFVRRACVIAFFALALTGRAQNDGPRPIVAKAPDRTAATDGHVWGALVYASDLKPDVMRKEPAEFPNLFARLGKAFKFKHFTILGEHNQDIFREYESWVVPSKDLFLKLDSKGVAKGGGINLHVQFWQRQQVLIKTDVVLRQGSPLFIAGPKWRDGRLIFVLSLKGVEPRRR